MLCKASVAAEEFLAEVSRRVAGELPGLTTGFSQLDEAIGGLIPGELVLICSRRFDGKRSLMLEILLNVCNQQERPCLLFSLKDNRRVIVAELLSKLTDQPWPDLFSNRVRENDLSLLSKTAATIQSLPLFLDDTHCDMEYLEEIARRHKDNGVQCIFMDGLFDVPLDAFGEELYRRLESGEIGPR